MLLFEVIALIVICKPCPAIHPTSYPKFNCHCGGCSFLCCWIVLSYNAISKTTLSIRLLSLCPCWKETPKSSFLVWSSSMIFSSKMLYMSEHLHGHSKWPLLEVKFRRDLSTGFMAEFHQDNSWPLLEFSTLLHQPASSPGLGLWCPSVGRRLTFKPCHFTGPAPASNPTRRLASQWYKANLSGEIQLGDIIAVWKWSYLGSKRSDTPSVL